MTSRWLRMTGFVLAVPSTVWAQERPWDWGHPMMWGWGMGMMVMMLVFWGLVIAGVVLLVRWLAGLGSGREGGGRESSLPLRHPGRSRYVSSIASGRAVRRVRGRGGRADAEGVRAEGRVA